MKCCLSLRFACLFAAAFAATFLGITSSADAQVVVPARRILRAAPTNAGPPPNIVGTENAPLSQTPGDEHPLVAPKPGRAKGSPRLQAFQQMQFDRRPTTILSVWSELELKADNGQSGVVQPGTEQPNTGQPSAAPDEDILGELNSLQRSITLSDWDAVAEGIRQFSETEQAQAYAHMLQSLASGPPMTEEMQQQISQNPQLQQTMEKNIFSGEDVFGIASAAPGIWEKAQLQSLGQILRQAITQGLVIDDFLEGLRVAVAESEPEPGKIFKRADAVTLLTAAGQIRSVGEFLPTVEEAELSGDIESLTLISQYCMSLYATEGDKAMLRKAWFASQAALAVPDVSNDVRTAAIRQSVELAPKLDEGGGEKWLAESFTQDADRGMQILAVIGAGASTGLQQYSSSPSYRQKSLELQKTAVEALLKAAPERAAEWSGTLNVLARVWLNEAEAATRYSRSTTRNPMLQRDVYGNLYYMDPNQQLNQAGNIRAIDIAAIMETRPNDEWMALLEESLLPRLMVTSAKLHLRVNEDKEAFPYIEQLAATHKDQATNLAKEFIQVWTRNHNPNQSAAYTDPYMYVFGFDVKAQSIPLTRSKQERNLDELAEWISRLRELQLNDIDENLLTTAFTTCHSTAEVYRLETIEHVFGSLDALEPDTLASLAQRMRQNLTSIWRDPAVQQSASTNRKKQDLEAEVKAGYVVAHNVLDAGINQHPDNWQLQLAKAALIHDENDYLQELSKSSEFAPRRNLAFEEFAKAAKMYAAGVPELKVEEESTQVYEVWFYAMLGACDPGGITHEKVPALRQIENIRTALAALQGDAGQRHMDRFANLVFTRMSALNPAVKSRYLDAAFEIVGDNERAFEAKKVHEYYADLVKEIKLEAKIDGSDVVGHGEPFGVFINIVHTPEIERESGGFGKYLQNQNNVMYAYNYGRPLENYRDKFRDAAIEVLSEHFEVMSVTFQAEDVNSRAIPGEYGWRKTPYAYALLKSRSEAVDTLPPLRLDLDFLDTSGYVVLPIESPPAPLDCSGQADVRPLSNLEITQTLDERQSKDGKLILEVKAKGNGIIPTLDKLVDINFPGFKVQSTDDEDISVTRFDPESRENAIVGERLWLITLQAEQTGEKAPAEFSFALPTVDAKTSYQRYVDADLEDVAATISLEAQYGEASYAWVWWLAGGIGLLGLLGFVFARALSRPGKTTPDRFQLPERVTPFSVLSLLRDIEENNGLDESSRRELQTSIVAIERSYFDKQDHDTPDLDKLAHHWVTKSKRR